MERAPTEVTADVRGGERTHTLAHLDTVCGYDIVSLHENNYFFNEKGSQSVHTGKPVLSRGGWMGGEVGDS